ncbi:hypothetical protein PTSG_05065 [Salpingoeca rosetta]|uniref:Inhibitor of growth protein n=1 Tax=Salpingoeca rosetta (strain ATCC 50818 / BSB-021) TaxID=946362 RepID=F2U9F0_SALR5|nr:uncharacterized protein PTSG_05065 [Salpingoeca rosetta]EGD73353.1 hypothetical protein PTSG_05065 [Salpingoeca rosetta]|eukprot:XP_004994383.1 hypothetical protein PTSG_05065 [Salpingoeca rosetta]
MSATYLTQYLATFEVIPGDVQRHLSLIRQQDMDIQGVLREVESLKQKLSEPTTIAKFQGCVQRLKELNASKQVIIDDIQELLDQHNKLLQQEKQKYLSGNYAKPREENGPRASTTQGSSSGASGTSAKRRARQESRRSKQGKTKDTASSSTGNAAPATAAASSSRASASGGAASSSGGGANKTAAVPAPAVETSAPTPAAQAEAKKRSSKKASRKSRKKEKEQEQHYCVPNCTETTGDMVACDNDDCPGEWFHYQCVGLTAAPTSKKWFCPECRPSMERRR